MTYASDLGYKVGDKFKIKPEFQGDYVGLVEDGYLTNIEAEIVLMEDDGTTCPFWTGDTGKVICLGTEVVEPYNDISKSKVKEYPVLSVGDNVLHFKAKVDLGDYEKDLARIKELLLEIEVIHNRIFKKD